MGVHDNITEEFFQSFILWNNYFRIAEVARWEFTMRSQRSSLPTLQCRLLITFPVNDKLKGQSHEVQFVLKAYLNKTLLYVHIDFFYWC